MMLHVAGSLQPPKYTEKRLCGKRTANTKLSLNEEKVSLPGTSTSFETDKNDPRESAPEIWLAGIA